MQTRMVVSINYLLQWEKKFNSYGNIQITSSRPWFLSLTCFIWNQFLQTELEKKIEF
jgi:hypothetical protein